MLMPIDYIDDTVKKESVNYSDSYIEWLKQVCNERKQGAGEVSANITIVSFPDMLAAKEGRLPKEEVRQVQVNSQVDADAFTLTITEEIREQLGLKDTLFVRSCKTADGTWKLFDLVGPVEVRFENRTAMVPAVVVPGLNKVLLGQQPLAQMDVLIDPVNRELVVNPAHPDGAVMLLY